MGMRLGLLAGIVFAVLKLMQGRRPSPGRIDDMDTWTSAIPAAPVGADPELVEPVMLTSVGQADEAEAEPSALTSRPVPESARAPTIDPGPVVAPAPPDAPEPLAEPVAQPVSEAAAAPAPVKKAARKKAARKAPATPPAKKGTAVKKVAPSTRKAAGAATTPPGDKAAAPAPQAKKAAAKKAAPRKRIPPPA